MIGLRHTLACCAAVFAVLAAVPLGCRQVLGIESRGSDNLTCDDYCTSIATACGAQGTLQYGSNAACLALCATFPVGTLQDDGPNTLGCRLRQVGLIGAEGVCAAAGPGGDGLCGSNCDSFCHSAVQVCPKDFESEEACQAICAGLPDCPSYFVDPSATTPPNQNTIQCRLYHVTAAALNPVTHCPHVLGIGYCTPDSGSCVSGNDGG